MVLELIIFRDISCKRDLGVSLVTVLLNEVVVSDLSWENRPFVMFKKKRIFYQLWYQLVIFDMLLSFCDLISLCCFQTVVSQ